MLRIGKIKVVSVVFLLVLSICSFAFAGQTLFANASTISELTQEKNVLFAAEEGYYDVTTGTLTKIGPINKVSGTEPVLANQGTLNSFSSAGAVSSTGGIAFRFHTNYNSYSAGAISFKNPIESKYVKSINVRMKVRLSNDSEFCENLGNGGNYGVRFFALGADGQNFSGHNIKKTIAQNEWIDYTISGTQLAELVTNDNGTDKLMGLQVGAAIEKQEDDSYFYKGAANEGNSYIVIDYITYELNEAKMERDALADQGRLLASADNSENLVATNLTQVNGQSPSSYAIYESRNVEGSANNSVWTASFHSSQGTVIANAIESKELFLQPDTFDVHEPGSKHEKQKKKCER